MQLPEVIRRPLHEIKMTALFYGYRLFKPGRTVSFEGRTYPYLYARYNLTVRNERAIELPIFREIVRQYRPEQVLEVGNVIAHYFPVQHTVLDKYERAPGVINEDVVTFQPGRTFDLIVAISTLEHVGWDETPRDPPKFRRAVAHLQELLAPGGRLMVSLPIGLNAEVDRLLGARAIPFSSVTFLKRMTNDNRWSEAPWDAVAGLPFDHGIPTAKGVAIGVIERPGAA